MWRYILICTLLRTAARYCTLGAIGYPSPTRGIYSIYSICYDGGGDQNNAYKTRGYSCSVVIGSGGGGARICMCGNVEHTNRCLRWDSIMC